MNKNHANRDDHYEELVNLVKEQQTIIRDNSDCICLIKNTLADITVFKFSVKKWMTDSLEIFHKIVKSQSDIHYIQKFNRHPTESVKTAVLRWFKILNKNEFEFGKIPYKWNEVMLKDKRKKIMSEELFRAFETYWSIEKDIANVMKSSRFWPNFNRLLTVKFSGKCSRS